MVEVVGDGFAQADDKPYDNITIAVKAANPVIRASDCMTLLLLVNLIIPTAHKIQRLAAGVPFRSGLFCLPSNWLAKKYGSYIDLVNWNDVKLVTVWV
jgi:hypothetical protein